MPDHELDSSEEIEASVRSFSNIGQCYGASWSPDNEEFVFICNMTGSPQVWLYKREGGWPSLVTAFEDPVQEVKWSPKDELLALYLTPGGGMNGQIYLVKLDGSDARRITKGGKDNNWLVDFTRDGRFLCVSSNVGQPDSMDSYLYNLEKEEFHLVARTKGVGTITDFSRDGRFALLLRVENRSDSNVFLLDLEDGSEKLLTQHDPPGRFGSGYFSSDGKYVYLSSDKDQEIPALQITVEDGEPGEMKVLSARQDAELDQLVVSDDGNTAALVWNAGGQSQLSFMDLFKMKEVEGPELPGEFIGFSSMSRGVGRFLAISMSGSNLPMNIWILDRENFSLFQLTHSPHPGVKLESLVKPKLVRFKAHDGLDLSGWLYLPKITKEQLPTVLSFHGGPEGQEVPSLNSLYQSLLEQGIAVFAPNVRGSTGFGKTFVNLDNGPKRFDAIKDIKSCVDFVVKSGVSDPKRMGIMGGSYGGYMTLEGLTEYPDLFAAGADFYGIVNFETFFSHTEPWMSAISKIVYGDPEKEKELLRSLSPIYKINRIKSPTLVLHGANDTNVPVVEAEQVVESLRKLGVPVELVLFGDEGHGFRKMENRIRANVATVSWVKKFLAN